MEKIALWLKYSFLFFMIIGIFGVALNILFNAQIISYLNYVRIDSTDTWIYTFDFAAYIKNIELSINDTAELELLLPTRQWQTPYDLPSFFDAFGNNMAMILDYIILILNVIIYPMRVGAYLLQNVLVVIGLQIYDPPQELEWLATLTSTLKGLQIPYIP